jgi:hypothetical protein
MFLGMGLFSLCYGIARILFLVGWHLTYDESTSLYDMFWQSATIFGMIGYTFIIFVSERYPLSSRTYYIGSIFCFGSLIATLIVGAEIGRIILAYSISAMGILLLLIYLYLIIISRGEIRRRSLVTFFGLVIMMAGIVFDADLMYEMIASSSLLVAYLIQDIIAPIVVIFGIIIFIYSYKRV